MKETKVLIVLMLVLVIAGCSSRKPATGNGLRVVAEKKPSKINIDSLVPEIAVYRADKIDYRRSGKTAYELQFSEPSVVSVATKPEKWGYFQFPDIEEMANGRIRVQWRLNDDAMEAYGNHKFSVAESGDNGRTWTTSEDRSPMNGFLLGDGSRIVVNTPKPIKVSDIKLPASVGGSMDTYSKSITEYYRLADLPEECQRIYFDKKLPVSNEWSTVKASLTDPQAARHVARGMLPIIWWGDLHMAPDKSIIAGIYPGFYVNESGRADKYHHVFFYRSTDNAQSWNIRGRIFYTPDLSIDTAAERRMGYTEPAYDILPDGTFICVMRTTDGVGNGPMYISRSFDKGITWTKPAVFTQNGVLPRLLRLENGVLVLSSGRPGVQLRFSNDGKGEKWSDAFEMLPYKNYKDQVSCGYTGLAATGPDRFLIVYSDFNFMNAENQPRKAIKVREVIVTPK